MFPGDARFICRKCLTNILFRKVDFKKIEKIGYIQCPKCGQRTQSPEPVSDFFNHYPWLAGFTSIMELNGFKPASYTVKARENGQGPESFIVSDFTFTCGECGGSHTIDLVNTDDWTADLYCRDCGLKPLEKEYAKSFFRHFIGLHDAQMNILELQADIFHPSRLDPDSFRIQRRDL